MNGHTAFTSHRIAYKNEILHKTTINDILPEIKASTLYMTENGVESKDKTINNESIKGLYERFLITYGEYHEITKKYTGLLGEYVKPGANLSNLYDLAINKN